jgi:hypothetical protein
MKNAMAGHRQRNAASRRFKEETAHSFAYFIKIIHRIRKQSWFLL